MNFRKGHEKCDKPGKILLLLGAFFFTVEAFSPCFLRCQVIYTRNKDDYDVDGDDGW